MTYFKARAFHGDTTLHPANTGADRNSGLEDLMHADRLQPARGCDRGQNGLPFTRTGANAVAGTRRRTNESQGFFEDERCSRSGRGGGSRVQGIHEEEAAERSLRL